MLSKADSRAGPKVFGLDRINCISKEQEHETGQATTLFKGPYFKLPPFVKRREPMLCSFFLS